MSRVDHNIHIVLDILFFSISEMKFSPKIEWTIVFVVRLSTFFHEIFVSMFSFSGTFSINLTAGEHLKENVKLGTKEYLKG